MNDATLTCRINHYHVPPGTPLAVRKKGYSKSNRDLRVIFQSLRQADLGPIQARLESVYLRRNGLELLHVLFGWNLFFEKVCQLLFS